MMKIPNPDYRTAGSFGSLELRKRDRTEFIGQAIDYSDEKSSSIRSITLDSLNCARIDRIKIDVEGMELEALEGATASLMRCRPILIVESIKTDKAELRTTPEKTGYRIFEAGLNFLAIHETDRCLTHVKVS